MTLTIIYPNDPGIDYPLYTQPRPWFSIHGDFGAFGAGLFPRLCDTGENARLSS